MHVVPFRMTSVSAGECSNKVCFLIKGWVTGPTWVEVLIRGSMNFRILPRIV